MADFVITPPVDLLDALDRSCQVVENARVAGMPAITLQRPERLAVEARMNGCAVQRSCGDLHASIVDDFTTFDSTRPRLAENGDQDAMKASIIEVFEDELNRTVKRVKATLSGYNIVVIESATIVDALNQVIFMRARTNRSQAQLQSIMSNMRMRRAVKGHLRILVDLKAEVGDMQRQFTYCEDALLRAESFASGKCWDTNVPYGSFDFAQPGGGHFRCTGAFSVKTSPPNQFDDFWKNTKFVVGTRAHCA